MRTSLSIPRLVQLVVMMLFSCSGILERFAVFSEAADDHSSLDETSVSVPLLSAGFNVMPFA